MKDTLKVFTFSGLAGSGKSTAAAKLEKIIKKFYPDYKVARIAYGDYLKYICKTFYGWDGRKNKKGRSLLQRVGTDIGRAKNDQYWIKSVYDQLEFWNPDIDILIIEDARFNNEIDFWIDKFGLANVIDIHLLGTHDSSRLTDEQAQHASETEIMNRSFAIELYCPDMEDLGLKLRMIAGLTL